MYIFLSSYPGSTIIYNADGKENTEEEEGEVKVTYILLSGTLAVVVTSADVRGTLRSPFVVDVRCPESTFMTLSCVNILVMFNEVFVLLYFIYFLNIPYQLI